MSQPGTTQHRMTADRSPKQGGIKIQAQVKSPLCPPSRAQRPGSGDYKDQLLCELEQHRTISAEQIRSLEKIRRDLEQTQEFLTAFYTQAPVGYLTLTQRGQIQNPNAAATALFGLDRARLDHLPFALLVHRDDVRHFLRHVARCNEFKEEKITTELRLRTPIDEPLRIQLISVPVGQGEQRSFLTAIVDLSDRVRSERELAEAKEFSESIVETVSQPLVVLDGDLRVISVNRAFVEFFGQTAEYAQGRVFEVMLNLWWSGNAVRAELEKVLVKDKPLERFQIETVLRGVGKRVLLLSARRLSRKAGSRPLILVAMEDITIRKQAEEQLRGLNQELEVRVSARTDALKKSNDQMESFCYSIAHDLRSPLRSMTGFSTLLLSDYGPQLGEKGRDYTKRIHESAERMDQLVGDLLNYGRLNTFSPEIEEVNVEEIFRDILKLHEQEVSDRRAKVTKKGNLPQVYGNSTILQTVLANLLSNAIKFVPRDVGPVVSVYSEDRGGFSRIWVEDNGIGIAPQNRNKIFGIFERLHSNDQYPGTGIGLAIVHKGIERMGGRVGVESELNKGSRFWIELRKAVKEPAKNTPRAT